MGVDYYASLCHGVCLDKDELIVKKKNPNFGKFKFDPNTGEKVNEFDEEQIKIEELAEKMGFDTESSTDQEQFFIGRCSKRFCIGMGAKEYTTLDNMMSRLECEKLLSLCKEIGIEKTYSDIHFYAVGCCSY